MSLVLLLTLLLQAFALPVDAAPTRQTIPDYVQQVLQSGEQATPMTRVSVEGRSYELYLISNGAPKGVREAVFYETDKALWDKRGITAVLVFDASKQLVTKEDDLRKIFQYQLGGFLGTQNTSYYAFVPAEESIIQDLAKRTQDPLFQIAFVQQEVASLFSGKGDADRYTEALRLMMANNDQVSSEFANQVADQVRSGQVSTFKGAIDNVIKMETFANNKQLREAMKGAEKKLEIWDKAGVQYKIGTYEVTYANWLDLAEFTLNMIYLQRLSPERAQILSRLAAQARQGNIRVSADLLSAMDTVIAEANDPALQRWDFLDTFLREHAGELIKDVGEQALREMVTKAIWKEYGKRLMGHIVAGAFASVFVAFDIANILYGMDAIYENGVTAEYSAKITEVLENDLKALRAQSGGSASTYPETANLYRELAVWWNFSMGRSYIARANEVLSSRVLNQIGQLNFVFGPEWNTATQGLLKSGEDGIIEAYNTLVAPEIIEYAIGLPARRLIVGPVLPGSASSTVLIFDTSGSMLDLDASGQSKIDAARKAGGNILDVVSAENSAAGSAGASQVGAVGYSTTAYVVSPLTGDTNAVKASLQNLTATNSTGMPDGLSAGLSLFAAGGQPGRNIVILLSDGLPNVGLGGTSIPVPEVQQQVLDLATQAKQSSICIYTVGFGDPASAGSSIDENFLRQVADASGCGKYYSAQDTIQLSNVYVELRHASTGNILLNQSGQISQNQTLDLGQVSVPDAVETMLFTLNWPGSKLEPSLVDPTGKKVDANYQGASVSATASLVSIVVNKPKAGAWKVSIFGADVPEGITNYKTIVSTRQGVKAAAALPAATSGLPFVIITILIGGGGVGVYAYSRVLKRRRGQGTAVGSARAWLIVTTGECAGERLALRDGFTIGRASSSSLRLKDPAVSRQHVVLREAQGAWFLQDNWSSGGTLVNGQPVKATHLSPGDQIRVGNNVFIFQMV